MTGTDREITDDPGRVRGARPRCPPRRAHQRTHVDAASPGRPPRQRPPAGTGCAWASSCATAPGLTRIGFTRQLRHLLRPWLDAAWTIDDVLTALDRHPVTGARPHALTNTPARGRGAIRNPAGWLLTRLRDWTHPLPSHADRTATIPPPARTAARAALQHNAAREWRPVRRPIPPPAPPSG